MVHFDETVVVSFLQGFITFIEEAIVSVVTLINATKNIFKVIGSGISGMIDIINALLKLK